MVDRASFDLVFGILFSCFICFGVLGNLTSIFIWSKGRRCAKSPGKIYLIALAVSDTIALCLPVLELATELLFGIKPQDQSLFLCRFELYGLHFGLIISAWIIACFTLERTIAVTFPYRSVSWISNKRRIIIILVIFISNVFINIPYAVGSTLLERELNEKTDEVGLNTLLLLKSTVLERNENNSTSSDVSSTSMTVESTASITDADVSTSSTSNIVTLTSKPTVYCGLDPSSFIFINEDQYHFWFQDFVIWFILPFTIIIGSNIAIFVELFRPGHQTNNESRGWEASEKKAMISRAVALSVVHCICAGSFSIASLNPGFFRKAYVLQEGNYYYIGIFMALISFANHSINFILYSFCGRAFRHDCNDLLYRKVNRVLSKGFSSKKKLKLPTETTIPTVSSNQTISTII